MEYKLKTLLDFLFSGTTLRRWNGFIHPIELTEIDRQGHKMMIAWFIYMLERPYLTEKEQHDVYIEIVEGAFFTYCLNLALTDIKPSIYERICTNPEHHKAIISWACERFIPLLSSLSPLLAQQAEQYLSPPAPQSKGREILKAASLYSRFWEYQLLRDVNASLYTDATILQQLSEDIERQCERLVSFKKILPQYTTSPLLYTTALRRIASLCGSLRFQRRWSQVVRLPETNVLGHSFLVSSYSFIFSTLVNACPSRRANTFFGALFHDLPELVTQDIVNPVKHSSQSIAQIIQEYEHQEMETCILSPLTQEEPRIAEELQYLLGYSVGSEFYNTVRIDGHIQKVSFPDLQEEYNHTLYSPKDGTLIKLCDNLSALLEAHTSIIQGVSPQALREARQRILNTISEYTFCSSSEGTSQEAFINAVHPHIAPLLAQIYYEMEN